MDAQIVKMRKAGVEIDRRMLAQAVGQRGILVILDVTDQGLRRPCKVARLLQQDSIRCELADVHIVWLNERRMALTGFERGRSETGQVADYARSWLVTFIEPGSIESRRQR